MMTWLEFKESTDKLKGGARGSKMTKVDLALQDWWKNFPLGANQTKKDVTLNLFTACKDWLKNKQAKKDVSFLGSINELLVRRREKVRQLASQALDILLQLDPNLKAEVEFNRNKVKGLAKGTYQAPTKSLGGGYAQERSLYLSSGKQENPVSGSGVHTAQAQMKNPDQMKIVGITLDRNAQKLAHKEFEKLTDHDFETINQLAQKWIGGGHVGYYKKRDRLQFMLFLSGNSFVDQDDNPYTTKGAENTDMYALDGYGNLFVSDGMGLTKNVEFFNHSSFNAGKPVMSAGELTITAGKLIRINNNSGHYKPTRENLHAAIKFFSEEGVDLSHTNVEVKTPTGWDSYKAATFLQNAKATPDGLKLDFKGKRI